MIDYRQNMFNHSRLLNTKKPNLKSVSCIISAVFE